MGFLQSQKAQDIISQYLDKPYQTPPAINPIFDLREPGQEFPPLNPPVQTDPVVDPCPPGYQLIDGVCQPIDQFGGNMMEETGGGSDDDMEEQPYFSIDAMRDLSDKELIDYLSSGFLTNSGMLGYLPSKGGKVTFKDGIPNLGSALLQLPFNQSQLRKDAMENELMRRGFFTGQFDDNLNRIYDIQSKPDKGILFQPRADTNEADVTYGGNQNIVTDAGGSYGGGEDFGSPFTSDYQGGYQGNVVINNQQVQKERERVNKVVQDIQSGKKTQFGGL